MWFMIFCLYTLAAITAISFHHEHYATALFDFMLFLIVLMVFGTKDVNK